MEQEPHYLSWNNQIVAIIGIVIVLVVFLTIIGSEINAAAQASIPNLVQMFFANPIPL